MGSYSRACKKCGQRINLRKMPGGQWVAFEGYDSIHKCGSHSAARSTVHGASQKASGETVYDSIEFPDIQVNITETTHAQKIGSSSSTVPKRFSQGRTAADNAPSRSTVPNHGGWNVPHWLWWLMAGLAIYWWVVR